MNCANHQQTPAAAYCRTCGKALCANCTRPVMGVIYCENCLAEKVSGTAPPQTTYQQGVDQGLGVRVPPGPTTGPNPALAGILGAIPFGVGAIYNGQYAKGLAHLGIFILLVIGANQRDPLDWICGIGIAAFVIYQIFDSVRTAKAIQANQPVPDPFGLATMFSPGDRTDFSKGVPTGAVVLIGLGVLFLLHNLGFWFLGIDRLWPVLLIALGVWLFAKRQAAAAQGYHHRSLAGPAVLVTVGVLSLVDNLNGPRWDRTWPVILLVIGVIKLLERGGHLGPPSAPLSGPPPNSAVPPEQQPPSEVNTEVKNG
jgi:cell wall-active antibiotic response 4TMS protein YvqF/B-box zinc finger protein